MTYDVLIDDGICTATWRSRPGDFVSLMTLYESNYIRLRHLAHDIFALPDAQVSDRADDCPLHVRVVERSPYTLTLTLTYQFEEGGAHIADPDLQVRVYRDAKLAEAFDSSHWHRHAALNGWRKALHRLHLGAHGRDASHAHLDLRWQRNMMLNKWLEYCADRGHRFACGTAAPALG